MWTRSALALTFVLCLGSTAAAPTPAVEAGYTAAVSVPAPVASDKGDRPGLDEYELGRKDLALNGYDPTSYFPAFGGEPKKGSKKVTAKYRGVLYRFRSDRSRRAFLAAPDKYEPMYGGWCAWAIAKKKPHKVEPTPSAYTIEGGRLFLFYNGLWDNTKKKWVKNGSAPKLKARADGNWTKMSGEAKRASIVPKPKPKPAPKPSARK